ncbi:MAG TPA: DUF3418 domain-containing protein, partial [Actinomycetaceae bacterium]|nr:DUF3418 domain-containing protein [Actinomycetaceae bacterium]
LPRYLRAAVRRIERARDNVHQDAHHAWQITELREAHEQAQAAAEARHDLARLAELEGVRWLLEELRVSLFAQQLGTPVRVSAKRIRRLLD